MKLGIIGAGNMGKALGNLAAKAGYEVLYAAQTEESAKAAAESTGHGARFGSVPARCGSRLTLAALRNSRGR